MPWPGQTATGEVRVLRVLLAAAGSPPPTFIARRINALARLGVAVYAAGGEKVPAGSNAGVHWYRESRSPRRGMLRLVAGCLRRPRRARRLLRGGHGQSRGWFSFLAKHAYLFTIPRPDLIHVQWVGSAAAWRPVAEVFAVPLIASVRGSQVTVYLHRGEEYRQHLARCLAAADSLHCVSRSLAERCQELGVHPARIFVNYNGIDLVRFSPGEPRAAKEGFRLVTVGALVARKNLSHALLALKSVAGRCGDVQLQIVGDGEERIYLRHAAERLGLGQRVQFPGNLEESQIAAVLCQADVYLSTSMAEGLANAVVEAAACGLPVVAYQCEGMGEIVEEAVNGFLRPFGDVEGVVGALCRLADDPALRVRMGEASRGIAAARFDQEACAQAMTEHYRRMVNEKRHHD